MGKTFTGDLIRKYRKEKGLTQKQLGELCTPEINEANIRKYELGTQNPKLETLRRIANALDIPLYNLAMMSQFSTEEIKKDFISHFSRTDTATPKVQESDHESSLLSTLKPGEKVTTQNIQENKLLSDFRELNGFGKTEAIKRVEELTEIKKYTDNTTVRAAKTEVLNAAHERTDIEVTDEMRKHDDAIMDDENF